MRQELIYAFMVNLDGRRFGQAMQFASDEHGYPVDPDVPARFLRLMQLMSDRMNEPVLWAARLLTPDADGCVEVDEFMNLDVSDWSVLKPTPGQGDNGEVRWAMLNRTNPDEQAQEICARILTNLLEEASS